MMTVQTNANRQEACGNYFYFYNLLFSESLLHLCLRALRSELLDKAGDISLFATSIFVHDFSFAPKRKL